MYIEEQQSVMRDVKAFQVCAFYGRYSTQMQRPASLEDQLRASQEFAASAGWILLPEHCYSDAGRTGTYEFGRTGLTALKAALELRPLPFTYILFDDTSRLGRDVADVLNFKKLTDFHRIGLRFIAQQLDTQNPQFDLMLQLYSMMDSQHVERQSKKSFAGMKGRVLAGYHVGSVPYGYKIVRVANPDLPNSSGQAATLGSNLVQVPEQVIVVRRIFELFADGHSVLGIAKTLNADCIPSPQNARAGRKKSGWGPDPVKDILHNEKYKGWNVWNVTTQHVHPTTGRIVKVLKPASEHVRMFLPHLRVVSDEAWARAAERLGVMQEAQVRRVQGGYNRAANKPYLYSGFLVCGGCGSKLIMGGRPGKGKYRCPNNLSKRGCLKSITIPERQLAAELTAALATDVFHPDYLEALISEVADEVQVLWKRQQETLRGEELPDIERQIEGHRTKINALLDRLEEGGSVSMNQRLAEREFQISRLETRRELLKGKKNFDISRATLARLLYENMDKLLAILQADIPLARQVLTQHIKVLTVHSDPANAKEAALIGEIDLFSGELGNKFGELLGVSGTRNPQQLSQFCTTVPDRPDLDHLYRFIMPLDVTVREPCLLLEPLTRLLHKRPELSSAPHYPSEWAKWVREELGADWPKSKRLGYGAIARFFRVHRELLSETLDIHKFRDSSTQGHLYQISLIDTAKDHQSPYSFSILQSAA